MKHYSFAACLFAFALTAGIWLAASPANAQPDEQFDGEIRAACVKAPVRACVLELARRIAMGVAQKPERGNYLSEVAEAQASAGLRAEAEATAEQALHEVESLQRNYVPAGVAKTWAKLDKFTEATRLADELKNTYARSDLLTFVAVGLGRAGRLAEGLQLVQAIEEKRSRDLAVRRVAWELRFIALESGEEGMLIDAPRFVEMEEERPRFALARAGQKAEAAAAFAGALQAALSINYDWKVTLLVFIADKMPE